MTIKISKFKRVMSALLIISLMLGLFPASIIAAPKAKASTEVEQTATALSPGTYQSMLNITDWGETAPVNEGLRISHRAMLEVAEGSNTVEFQVTGYSQYKGIYMVNQASNDAVADLNLNINDMNDTSKYTKLENPISQDPTMDTAIFRISNFDYTQKLGLIGFVKDNTLGVAQKNITFKVNLDLSHKSVFNTILDATSSNASLKMGVNTWLYGKDKETANPWEGFAVAGSANWNKKISDYEDSHQGSLKESAVDHVDYKIQNKKIVAQIYLNEVFKTQDFKAYEAIERNTQNVQNKENAKVYSAYLAGNAGLKWSDQSLYHSDKNYIEVSFNAAELKYGKELKVTALPFGGNIQTINICLSEKDYGPQNITDKATGVIYRNGMEQLAGNVKLDVTTEDEGTIAAIKKTCGEDGDFRTYAWNLTKDGKDYTPSIGGKIMVPIPADWSTEEARLYGELFEKKNGFTSGGNSWPTRKDIQIEQIGNQNYFVKTFSNTEVNRFLHHGSMGLCSMKEKVDLYNAGLTEGIYTVDVGFLKEGSLGAPSMANGVLDNAANNYLVVGADGTPEAVYLNFKPLDMGDNALAYLGALGRAVEDDVTYLNYEINEDGSLMDNAGFDAATQFPCVKTAKLNLKTVKYEPYGPGTDYWDETNKWNEDRKCYECNVIPPAMGAGMPYEQIKENPIGADLVFYSVKPAGENVILPTYQKSVLRKSIDQAKTYGADAYTEESFASLTAALGAGEALYDQINGPATAENSVAIGEESNAIEAAIKALAFKQEIAAAREALNTAITNANNVMLNATWPPQNCTKSPAQIATFQKAIDDAAKLYNSTAPTVELLEQEKTKLQQAQTDFEKAIKPEAQVIEDGSYTATATMLHEYKAQSSMCDGLFDNTAQVQVKGDNAFITLKVAYPVPAFPNQGKDGTVKNMILSDSKNQKFAAVSDITTKPNMIAKSSNTTFGTKQGQSYEAQVLTFSVPKAVLTEDTLKIDTYVNVVMNSDQTFRMELSELKAGETPDIGKQVIAIAQEKINAIGKVTLEKEAKIVAARAVFDTLTPEQQEQVSNAQTLKDAEAALNKLKEEKDQAAVDKVTALIEALPAADAVEVTHEGQIATAVKALENLTEAQKKKVSEANKTKLTEVQKAINKKLEGRDKDKAKPVSDLIAALPQDDALTLDNKEAVAEARAAFNQLTTVQQGYVENSALLTAAEAKLAELQAAADQAAAQAVTDKINGLPAAEQIQLSNKADIEAARAAYTALTEAQKALVNVEVVAKLEAAEAQLKALENEQQQPDTAIVYEVPVKLTKADKPNEASMGANAVDGPAYVTVKGNEYTYTLHFKGINANGLYGHLLNLSHYNSFEQGKGGQGKQAATPSRPYTDIGLDGKEQTFNQRYSFTRNDGEKTEVYVEVTVDAMGSDKPQDAKLLFNWKDKQVVSAIPVFAPSTKLDPQPGVTPNPDGSTTEKKELEDGTIIETTKKPDGSTNEKTTKPDGTTINKTTDKEGNINEKTSNVDGSTKTDITMKDGSTSTTLSTAEGKTETTVQVPKNVIEAANKNNEEVVLPMPKVEISDNKKQAPTVNIKLDSKEQTQVVIPAEKIPAGAVAFIVAEDGSKQVIRKTGQTKEGIRIPVQGNVTVMISDNAKNFKDTKGHWGEDAAAFASSHEMFNGTSKNTFAPDSDMTRGMVATVLHNLENNPKADVNNSFGDVKDDAWYADGITWAAKQGIVAGVGHDNFAPNDSVTREQLAVMLYRYAGSPKVADQQLDYKDSDKISGYAKDAMIWATEKGIISGMGDGSANPQGTATRAQVASILMRFVNGVN